MKIAHARIRRTSAEQIRQRKRKMAVAIGARVNWAGDQIQKWLDVSSGKMLPRLLGSRLVDDVVMLKNAHAANKNDANGSARIVHKCDQASIMRSNAHVVVNMEGDGG